MNKFVHVVLFSLLICHTAWGKKTDSSNTEPDNEPLSIVSLGLGINSTNYALKGQGLLHAKTYQNEGSMCLLSMSYMHRITRHSYMGLSLAADQQHGEWMTSNRPSSDPYYFNTDIGIFSRNCLTMAAEYRIEGIVRKNFILYATIGAGATLYEETLQYNNDTYMQGYFNGVNKYGPDPRQVHKGYYFNAYVSPVGVQVGPPKFRFFFEVGFGYKGLLHGGINYSFN